MSVLATLLVFGTIISVALGEFCYDSHGNAWTCTYGCCTYSEYYGCCASLFSGYSYWYAWFIGFLFFLVCLCSCIGCGTYGYRRRYVVRHVAVSQPTYNPVPVVVTNTRGYQQPSGGYQQIDNQQYATGYKTPPPPYNPY